jgi:hypothetical protein
MSTSPTTKHHLVAFYKSNDSNNQKASSSRVDNDKLLDAALKQLAGEGLIELEEADFGDAIILQAGDLHSTLEQLAEPKGAYRTFFRAGQHRERWLFTALDKVKSEAIRLDIQDSDFDNPEADWSPIPIDRDQPETKAVIAAVEDAAEKLRSDNGYAATKPAERQYVMDGLSMFLKRMKESGTVSIPYIRQYAIDPLTKAFKSLGRSATGLVVEVARAEIKAWLLKQGIPWPFEWP